MYVCESQKYDMEFECRKKDYEVSVGKNPGDHEITWPLSGIVKKSFPFSALSPFYIVIKLFGCSIDSKHDLYCSNVVISSIIWRKFKFLNICMLKKMRDEKLACCISSELPILRLKNMIWKGRSNLGSIGWDYVCHANFKN